MRIEFKEPFFDSNILDVDIKLPWYLRPFKKIIDRYARHRFKLEEQFGYRTEDIQASNIQDTVTELIYKMRSLNNMPEVILMGPDHHKALLFDSMSFGMSRRVRFDETQPDRFAGLTVILVPWYDGIMVLPKTVKPHMFLE